MLTFLDALSYFYPLMNQTAIQLSVAIITYNEERNIERCIRSVQPVADEIVVVDSFSTDRTQEICQRLNVRFTEHAFEGYVQQKNFSLTQLTHPYVLSLDADEALSETLQQSILRIKNNGQSKAYRFNRLTNYCGQWIRHCGWYPDTKTRLWDRTVGHWGGESIHESVVLDPQTTVTWLAGDLLHYSYYSIADHAATANNFSEVAADEAIRGRRKVNLLVHVLLNPIFTFVKKYFFQQGFRDGYYGGVISVLSAYANFLKYSKIYAHQRRSAAREAGL